MISLTRSTNNSVYTAILCNFKENTMDILVPYNVYSRGARGISKALGIKIWNRQKRVLEFKPGDRIINWGVFGNLPDSFVCLNRPQFVNLAGNKFSAFEAMNGSGVRVPEYTGSYETAIEWVNAEEQVLGRKLRGSCGNDIQFFGEDLTMFSQSDFWVKYKKKKDEYRVHVFDGDIIHIQKKSLRMTDDSGNPIDKSKIDFRIRNLSHGFIFKIHGLNPPVDVLEQAVKAVKALGLDFGAVDVIWNDFEGKAYVLEVNTAPGLEGSSIDAYAGAIRRKFPDIGTTPARVPEKSGEPTIFKKPTVGSKKPTGETLTVAQMAQIVLENVSAPPTPLVLEPMSEPEYGDFGDDDYDIPDEG